MVDLYLIWSNEHRAWWRPVECGYCQDELQAGIYTRERAMEICENARAGWHAALEPPELPVRIKDLPTEQRQAIATLHGFHNLGE